jgi:hypothetical protein
VKDLVFQHHMGQPLPAAGTEQEAQVWAQHPSRVDVFGMGSCQACGRPAPRGELQRWRHCSFCQRRLMDEGIAMGTASDSG